MHLLRSTRMTSSILLRHRLALLPTELLGLRVSSPSLHLPLTSILVLTLVSLGVASCAATLTAGWVRSSEAATSHGARPRVPARSLRAPLLLLVGRGWSARASSRVRCNSAVPSELSRQVFYRRPRFALGGDRWMVVPHARSEALRSGPREHLRRSLFGWGISRALLAAAYRFRRYGSFPNTLLPAGPLRRPVRSSSLGFQLTGARTARRASAAAFRRCARRDPVGVYPEWTTPSVLRSRDLCVALVITRAFSGTRIVAPTAIADRETSPVPFPNPGGSTSIAVNSDAKWRSQATWARTVGA